MSNYGLLPQGFVRKPAPVIKAEVDEDFKNAFGQSVGSEPDNSIPAQSSMGQEIGILVDLASACWELAELVHAAGDPDQASGAALDAVCAITGTNRRGKQFSIAPCVFVGTNGTQLRAGRVLSVTGTRARFATFETKTLEPLPAWVAGSDYAPGNLVQNGGRSFVCWFGGTAAGVGPGPSAAGSDIVDGSVHWRGFAGVWPGAVAVDARAEEAGPIAALYGTLSNIETPVAGVTQAFNYLDATVGVLREEDADLRVRREAELQAEGVGPVDAIRAALLRLKTTPPVSNCTVFFNNTDTTVDGIPPHGVEVMVEGGDDGDVALAVWRAVGGGIQAVGNQTTAVIDAAGRSQTVHWSRPSPVRIYVDITGSYDARAWPSDGATQIKNRIVAFGLTLPIGRSVRSQPIGAVLVPDQVTGEGVAGVLEITQVLIGTANPPVSSATVAITSRQRASIAAADIAVHMSPGVP